MKKLLVLALTALALFAGSGTANAAPVNDGSGTARSYPVSDGSGCVSPTNSNWWYPVHTYFPYSTGYYTAWTRWSNQPLSGYWSPYELYCDYNPGAGTVVWTIVW